MSPTVLSVMLRLLLGILWELYPEPPSLKGAFSTFKNYREKISSALEKGGPLAPREGRPWLSSLDLPVRLIAFPEGALQGFNDEVLDLDHAQFAREGAKIGRAPCRERE